MDNRTLGQLRIVYTLCFSENVVIPNRNNWKNSVAVTSSIHNFDGYILENDVEALLFGIYEMIRTVDNQAI